VVPMVISPRHLKPAGIVQRGPRSIAPVILLALAGPLLSLSRAESAPPIVDDRWTVTVNGQTIRVNPNGSFRLANVSAPDLFGDDGPGSPADFMGDDWLQVVGTALIDGRTWYAYSEPFQITMDPMTRDPETCHIQTLPVSPFPLFPCAESPVKRANNGRPRWGPVGPALQGPA